MVGKRFSYGGAGEHEAECWGVCSEMSAVITGLCQVPNVPSPSKKPQKSQAAIQGNQPVGYSGIRSADPVTTLSRDDVCLAVEDP